MVGCLCYPREADTHIFLNPQRFHPWGVHFCIGWLLDPDVSLLIRLGCVTAGLVDRFRNNISMPM